MNVLYEFLSSSGSWKQLYVNSWDDAIEKSKEYGYKVRKVRLYYVEDTYDPNEKYE